MKKQAVLILADGFEEIEAVTSVDVLRRAGIDVIVAGVGGETIKSSRNMLVKTDINVENITVLPDVIILPGGMPGAEHIAGSSKVKDMIRQMSDKKKFIAAICASPAVVLAPLGVLRGRKATCFPGMEEAFPKDAKYIPDPVVQDGNLITGKGPAASAAFAFKILENLSGKDTATLIAEKMLFSV
ncbi:MAG TPA: DJ-1/PfpI family protein [Candidatus Omnitrophota bacterium]|nr:DJ-1/PfpI family protein [Candidatus Omnitrophota bacterium]HPS20376.1 DJ-1/PfpI family protein [Candidatus Omnitrophota bacterium]